MEKKAVLGFISMFLLSACTLRLTTTPPPTEAIVASPSATIEITKVQPTVVTLEPTTPPIKATGIAATPTLTQTMPISPTKTAVIASAPTPEPRFLVQAGTPVETANFVHPDTGCNWMGVAGQVFGNDEKPIAGLVVEVAGTLGDKPVLFLALTGGNTILGPGGYEITLTDQPVASTGMLWVQIFDLNGNPQSEKILFNTYAATENCDNNLIVINFNETGLPLNRYYLPVILKADNLSD
jgi:hypothetical protein